MHTPVCVCPLGWAQFTSNVPLQVGAQTTTCRRELALCVCATAPSFALGPPPGPSPWSLGISGLLAADAPQHLPLLCFAHALTHALVHVGVFMPAISGSLYAGHAGWRSTRQRRSSRSMGTAAVLVCSRLHTFALFDRDHAYVLSCFARESVRPLRVRWCGCALHTYWLAQHHAPSSSVHPAPRVPSVGARAGKTGVVPVIALGPNRRRLGPVAPRPVCAGVYLPFLPPSRLL